MPKRRKEISWNPQEFPQKFLMAEAARERSVSETEALLSAAPFEAPTTTQASMLPLREIIQDALDGLTELERKVFDALTVEKLSLRQLSSELNVPRTSLTRVRNRTRDKLADALREHPLVKEHYGQV